MVCSGQHSMAPVLFTTFSLRVLERIRFIFPQLSLRCRLCHNSYEKGGKRDFSYYSGGSTSLPPSGPMPQQMSAFLLYVLCQLDLFHTACHSHQGATSIDLGVATYVRKLIFGKVTLRKFSSLCRAERVWHLRYVRNNHVGTPKTNTRYTQFSDDCETPKSSMLFKNVDGRRVCVCGVN